jgi:hypothetical protein
LPVALSRSFLDTARCKTFSEVIVTEGGHPYVLGTRLTVKDGKITEIDSIVTDEGDWLFNAPDYLKVSGKPGASTAAAPAALRCVHGNQSNHPATISSIRRSAAANG